MAHDFNLRAPAGANRKKKVLGRGQGSGRGTTAGKGHKGQQARSGGGTPYVGFEGGQMPLYRRLAQRGFSNYPFKKEWQIVNLGEIEKRYAAGETVDLASLRKKRLLKGVEPIKILAVGDLTKKLSFKVAAVSASAKEKIEKAGGDVTVNPPLPKARPKEKSKKTGGKK
ncbi:MAG: 50S ribosomal protein L15 [Treponema sp.]|jgi:large subunit ribosomal protein L15|nr:50S ribosomal protein L15 [Treponema sp.]